VSAALVALAIAACNSDATGPGDGPLPPGLTLKADPFITSGLSAPVFLAQPLDDGRIFVVEQGGRIRLVKNGVLQTTPFLNISTRVLCCGERGLLSVAFHPQYATNHYFYVYFTSQTTGDIRIERFTTTANPEVADPATTKLIFTTPHPSGSNHNGGLVTFGPDGMLYVGSLASKLEKFDPATGNHQSLLDAENWVWSTPSLDGDTLYFGDVDGNIYSFNTSSGKLNWKPVKPDGPITASPLVQNDHILIATESGSIFAVGNDGKVLWTQQIGGKIYTTPVAAGDLTIVSPLETDFYLAALDANGRQVWTFTPKK